MKKQNIFGNLILLVLIVFLLTLLISINFVPNISAQLTEEEIEFVKRIRKQGIEIKDGKTETYVGRKFKQASLNSNGFVQNFIQLGVESYYKTKNIQIETPQNIKIKTSPDTETFVGFTETVDFSNLENFIKISGQGAIKDVDVSGNKLKVKQVPSNPAEFVLDSDGRLTTGTKFTTSGSKYNLNGFSMNLPENSIVKFLEGIIEITVPKDSLVDPIIENPEKVRGKIEIKSNDHSSLKTKEGRFQTFASPGVGQITTKQTSIFYEFENGNLFSYTNDPIAVFFNDKSEVDFSVVNPKAGTNDPKMYISFDNNNVDTSKFTLLVTNDNIGSINDLGLGPVINLGKGNRFNVGLNRQGGNDLASGQKTVSFQGNLGYAILSRGEAGKIPKLFIKGNIFW